MKLALFYEIPVAQPWAADSEHRALENALEPSSRPDAQREGG
jgi:hypothetical protein